MAKGFDQQLMARAIALAKRSPQADPNPRVGCVIAKGATIIAEGWHEGAGSAHAEVAALAKAGDDARGASAYVSLEPCNHTGKTGPCSQALVAAGIKRVVFAQSDPNPLAVGGATYLREHGVIVESGLAVEEAKELNRYWNASYLLGRPFVTWKVAASLDGRTAAANGTSQWITGEEARRDVHELRRSAGAIIVGTGTVLADNPRLTIREPDGRLAARQPLRVIVGKRKIPNNFRVFNDEAPTLQIGVQPVEVLAQLKARQIHHAWLEGGSSLAAAFWTAGLIDEVVCYLAPALLGAGPNLIGNLGVADIKDCYRMDLKDVRQIGDDVRLIAKPKERMCLPES